LEELKQKKLGFFICGMQEEDVLQTELMQNFPAELLERAAAKDYFGGEFVFNIADNDFFDRLKNQGYAFSFNVDELKEKFEKPSLFILGKQDSCVGHKDAWSKLDNYPRATFAVLDKAGHDLQLEQTELFNHLVNEWLDRVSSH
jgi:pimeloyl-ACP methyl ester carboxylesterase